MGTLGRCNGVVGCRLNLTLWTCVHTPRAESGLFAEDRDQMADQQDDSHGDQEPYCWTEATLVRVFLFKVGGVK
jgi:hypothetical protein